MSRHDLVTWEAYFISRPRKFLGVERVLDPSLRGKPVGITQKSLLATTSYEARARGVTKLMSIKKAKELVSDMILVDGEDLTNYRRFSREVVRLVGAIVGVKEGGERAVEKLGLDEVCQRFVVPPDR